MKKVSTTAGRLSKDFSERKLTIGLGLGDRWSWYCVLGEAGDGLQEQNDSEGDARGVGRNGKKRAIIATARKLAVLLHRLWVSGEVYELLRNSRRFGMPAAA
jgi:hypothetical protein